MLSQVSVEHDTVGSFPNFLAYRTISYRTATDHIKGFSVKNAIWRGWFFHQSLVSDQNGLKIIICFTVIIFDSLFIKIHAQNNVTSNLKITN